jgi:hypothetical protein
MAFLMKTRAAPSDGYAALCSSYPNCRRVESKKQFPEILVREVTQDFKKLESFV